MSESTYNQGLSTYQQLQEQALAIKRTIIYAWISDLPQTPPTPESPTARARSGYTSQVLRRQLERRRERNDASKKAYVLPRKFYQSARRQRSRRSQGVMEGGEDIEPLRRSKRT